MKACLSNKLSLACHAADVQCYQLGSFACVHTLKLKRLINLYQLSMFKKILIANRGEIAVRIIRTCRELGIKTVAVYSDVDRLALHTRLADEAYYLGPPPVRESYLNAEKIIAIAKENGAEAIHPGYGFLSENAGFAFMVEVSRLFFIGQPGAAMRAMGDKTAARQVITKAGVPTVPGSEVG